MWKRWLSAAVLANLFVGCVTISSGKAVEGLNYVYPLDHLKIGQSLGNNHCYVTLDIKTDIGGDHTSVRYGLRESTNQKYYLLGWDVGVVSANAAGLIPVTTTFTPAYQESELEAGTPMVRKKFFVPFESGYLRSAHFLLDVGPAPATELTVQSRIVFPDGVQVDQLGYRDHRYLRALYPDGAVAVLWGSVTLRSVQIRQLPHEPGNSALSSIPTSKPPAGQPVVALVDYAWNPGGSSQPFALSFAYALSGGEESTGMLLGALFDPSNDAAPAPPAHLERVHKLLDDSIIAIDRYLDAGRLWTPHRQFRPKRI